MDHQPEERKHGPTVPGTGQDRSGKEQVAFILRLALVLGTVSTFTVRLPITHPHPPSHPTGRGSG